MARIKYVYDTESCRYEREKYSVLQKLLRASAYLITALVMAIGVLLIRNTFYEPAEIRALRNDNEILEEHHEMLRAEFIQVNQVIEALAERNDNIYREIYEAEPVPDTTSGLSERVSSIYKEFLALGWDNESVVEAARTKIEKIKEHSKEETMNEVIRLMRENEEMLQHLPAIQPVANTNASKLASGFGMRINPFHKGRVMHFGIDFAVHRGENIVATGDGKVVTVKSGQELETGYGNYVEIDHGYGYRTRYAHLGEIKVKQGEEVKRGVVIALSGNSGGSVAPHIHYEVLKDTKQMDPNIFLIQGLDDHTFKELRTLARRENQALD